MAAFQIKDAYAVMNSLARQATAQADIAVVDHQSFIDAGTQTLATGTENVLNSIYRTIAQVVMQTRSYKGKFGLINASENQFNTRKAKISVYSSDNEASGAFNTDLYTNIANGQGDSDGAGSMWEQKLPKVLERFFLKEAVWDKHYTTPLAQLQNAFNDEAAFIAFMNGVMVEISNDVESTLEARNRALVTDRIAGTYLQATSATPTLGAECVVDLIKYFNDECGTTYTRDEILQEHLTEFMEIFVAKLKIDSDRLEERTALYHNPYKITENGVDYNILRFTPKANQKLMLFSEFIAKSKTRVMPEIFNPEYLKLENYEGVSYWQSTKPGSRMSIKCKPALPDGATSADVNLDYVVGILFDSEALQSINQFTGSYQTPVNARHLYTNTWMHWKFGSISDYSENTIIYILGEGGEANADDNT
ncbi:MAG: hypothetical protein VZR53_08855 [Prevotella sp.]|nr:hypothetical protein [Prevotella sp.]